MTVNFVLRTRHDNKIANVPLFCGLNLCCSRAESGDGLDIPCSPLYGLKVMIDCSPGSLAGSFDDLCLYFTLCSPLPDDADIKASSVYLSDFEFKMRRVIVAQ